MNLCTDKSLRFHAANDIFQNYLRASPLALALHRAAELRDLSRLAIDRPVLDLGCGFGQFASLALKDKLDVGLDISGRAIALAAERKCYVHLQRADARAMPFRDGQFHSVISVSALEHMPRPEAVAAEVFRVLKPGGSFVATLVLADVHRYLFYPTFFRKLGLRFLARAYERLHDQVFRHTTLLSQEEWRQILEAAGFEIVQCKRVVSPRVTRWFDILLLFAWPYRLAIPLGYPLAWRPRWVTALASQWFASMLSDDGPEGSNLFVVARKPDSNATERVPPESSHPASDEIPVHSPAPSVYSCSSYQHLASQ